MTDIASLTGAATSVSGGAAAFNNQVREEAAPASAAFASDFNTFLKLLTTQMENQDPLKPIESTEFVAQLAQFSSVEQQVATNVALGKILETIAASGAGALAEWLGRDVRAEAAINHTVGDTREAYPAPAPAGAGSAIMLVKSPDGAVVAEIPYTDGAEKVAWNGLKTDGTPAPSGVYSFESRFTMLEGGNETAQAQVFAKVTEARRIDGEIVLALEGGSTVSASDVQAVR